MNTHSARVLPVSARSVAMMSSWCARNASMARFTMAARSSTVRAPQAF
jgi:hypothetical protein